MELMQLILMLGGLGLFLFGMRMMSSGLTIIAGDRMQNILQKATSNRFLAVFVGFVATVAINSSTATTIMTVSFVNSGMLNLTQSIGIIMGANVGTTISGQLIAFRIDAYAPVFILIGVIMYMFFKKRSIKNIGYVILGFGILFFGITTLGAPLRELAAQPAFRTMLTAFENPFLAILAGFVFTAVVQSSTAASGILIAMHMPSPYYPYVATPIPFATAAFILLGVNIGTSVTTLIASIPANRESKRAALFHIMYDIIGSAVFGLLIFFVPQILYWFQATFTSPERQVAMFHTLYNLATMLLLLPFVKWVAALMKKIIPTEGNGKGELYERKLLYIDPRVQSTPSASAMQARREVERMANLALENYRLSIKIFLGRKIKLIDDALANEKIINYLNHEITRNLVRINGMYLAYADNKMIGSLYHVVNDIERVGDHAENIVEFSDDYHENEKMFSEEAISELTVASKNVENLLTRAIDVFTSGEYNPEVMDDIHKVEKAIDAEMDKYKEAHIKRMEKGICNPASGMLYVNMLTDLERIADHATNIAYSLRYQK
ncbi:MAG: Na/Pi cotransporter family protein [Oscillospiraceae bacterium]|nr:Na/Pi cotransporter family protein [Oscillospiraceae bacterium]